MLRDATGVSPAGTYNTHAFSNQSLKSVLPHTDNGPPDNTEWLLLIGPFVQRGGGGGAGRNRPFVPSLPLMYLKKSL